MKVRVHSWVDMVEDEDGKQWETSLLLTMPNGTYISFGASFNTSEDSAKWCTDFEAILVGCEVEINIAP